MKNPGAIDAPFKQRTIKVFHFYVSGANEIHVAQVRSILNHLAWLYEGI
jgi:hypothetical protein